MVVSKRTVFVCHGTGCVSNKAIQVREALEQQVRQLELSNIKIDYTGCHGFCQQGPIVVIEPEGVFYSQVTVDDVKDIVQSHLQENRTVERLLYREPITDNPITHYRDIPFYNKQQRIVLRNCGHINPERIDDYINVGGYSALQKALKMKPEEIIEEIKCSGLRGRGGVGFPTGKKWESYYKAKGDEKYVICNADEGDPDAFVDRSLIEGDPHAVLEGMIIAAYTIGAKKGFIYVRAEHPLAVKRLEIAVNQAKEKGFLGKNILGGEFNFDIEIFQGAGAFKRSMPRRRPPFPAPSALWGKATLITNVKTYAYVPKIILNGADWFASIGSEKSKGTVVFALTGKVANCGLVEVPMGITLREIIYGVGGGIAEGKKFKAVQTGGPSGNCITAQMLDLPVDYESPTAAGSIMDSGGMVVMDEDTCMVDVAHYLLDFTQKESCGECVPCRLGTKQMLDILEDITQGRGKPEDIDLLVEIGEAVKKNSLCGLGKTVPKPVLTTICYFREEYEAHILRKNCPAKVCRALIHYIIVDKCKGCRLCVKSCPADAIIGEKKKAHLIEQSKCIKCGVCFEVCPKKFNAVECISGQIINGGVKND